MNSCRLFKEAKVFWVFLCFLPVNTGSVLYSQEPRVAIEARDETDCLIVRGVVDLDGPTVVVRLAGAKSSDVGILGRTIVEDRTILFKPRFPLLPNRYRVEVRSSPNAQPTQLEFEIVGKSHVPTKVTAVYPSADTLPANTLKFYVHFSAPMRKGDIYQFVRLKKITENDQDSKVIELPFLEIEQEFWSRDSRRVTLLLDPGRIKRGLKPREEMGPIFEAGGTYELQVDESWRDATGAKLSVPFSKRFRVVEDDFRQPDPGKWEIDPPPARMVKPLVITFPDSLDHAMLQSAIVVVDENDNIVEGSVSVMDQEKKWSFEPAQEWKVGQYKLKVDRNLEDNSGNSIGRRFEVDVFNKTEAIAQPHIVIEFKISS